MNDPIKVGKVTASKLNMRASPGGPIIKVLTNNTSLQVAAAVGGWLQVRENGVWGYVSSQYVTINSGSGGENQKQQGFVNTSLLNLREEPAGPIIDQLPQGTPVTVLETKGTWFKVQTPGASGYVSGEYITLKPSEPDSLHPALPAVKVIETGLVGPDGKQFARKYKEGAFSMGSTSIGDFISANADRFQSSSGSVLSVMKAVSGNEGNFEAVNTWDNAFLSFGIFQWTTGVGAEAGELPAVLHRLQTRYPATFDKYFGTYGLAVTSPAAPPNTPPRGYFRLNGTLLGESDRKLILRNPQWAYIFWSAGHDDDIREIQTFHAMDRIGFFYRPDLKNVQNRSLTDYVTSEYGVALLLDQHVNRPGHVPGTLVKAVQALSDTLNVDKPQEWGDTEEALLLEKYLELRAYTNMTDSTARARKIAEKAGDQVISRKRNSFRTGKLNPA